MSSNLQCRSAAKATPHGKPIPTCSETPDHLPQLAMKFLLNLCAATAMALTVTSCSKSPANAITDVLEECANIGHKARAYTDPGSQADFVARSFQAVDVSDCPADFRMAFQAHVNAWQNSVSALANNTAGNAFLEGFTAGVTQDSRFIGQAGDRADMAASQINATYDVLTQIAAHHGATIPRSVVGE